MHCIDFPFVRLRYEGNNNDIEKMFKICASSSADNVVNFSSLPSYSKLFYNTQFTRDHTKTQLFRQLHTSSLRISISHPIRCSSCYSNSNGSYSNSSSSTMTMSCELFDFHVFNNSG